MEELVGSSVLRTYLLRSVARWQEKQFRSGGQNKREPRDRRDKRGHFMKAAILYARVSSREQEQEGYSIPAQIKCLREYAKSHNIEIIESFVEAETAKQAGRKRFGEMVTFLRSHPPCRIILVEKTDRLHRNMKDYVLLKELGDVEITWSKKARSFRSIRSRMPSLSMASKR